MSKHLVLDDESLSYFNKVKAKIIELNTDRSNLSDSFVIKEILKKALMELVHDGRKNNNN